MNNYTYWNAALNNQPLPNIDVNTPQSGFYKSKKHKDSDWFPIAIWDAGHGPIAASASGQLDISSVWPWCAKHPISEDDFRYFEKHGKWQGDVDVGHNNPPADEIQIEDQIKEVMAQAEKWLKDREIKSQAEADKAAGFQQKLSELSKTAEKKRVEEKAPHLAAGKAVDVKYKKIVDLPLNVIKALKCAITPFLIDQQKKAEEAQRRAQIEAAKKIAEAEKIRADEEKKNLTEKEEKIVKEAEQAVEIFSQPVKSKVSVGGNTGRKVSLRTITKAKITDYEKALLALKDHPEMRDFVQKLCDRAAKAEKEIDGMQIVKEQVAA